MPVPEVMITSTAPVNPILMGVSANPLLRIGVYVPAGISPVSYSGIQCRLNKTAVQDIDKLEVFFTDQEPVFAAVNAIASVSPTTTDFKIPVQLRLQPGWHYLWVSATLKETADIKGKVEVHCPQLLDGQNKTHRITEDQSSYVKRIGVPVRRAGDEKVNTYRIPGIGTTDKGTLISVYDIRYENSRDLPANIDVGMSRSTDGGKTWEPMKIIMDMGAPHENNGVGDPAILFDPVTKKIWVAALWSKGNRSIAGSKPGLSPDETGQLVLVSSADDGKTWSEPISITNQVKNPAWNLFFNGPGNGIAMQDGKLVFPAQYWDEKGMPHSTIIYSTDHGKNWKGSIYGPKANTTESQVIETRPGTLMLNMRDNRGRFRSVATTSNLGKDWVEHVTSYNTLPDPVCMGSLIKAKVKVKGQLQEVLFFSNPNNPDSRNNIAIKASLNLGETWLPNNQTMIDERPSFGYSSLTKIDDNTIGILYEGIKDLYFVAVPVNEIIK
ncbi:exo-alpha-sialidase [Adhaeribacter swui]|uniref:exo-alpha-sialidase n=2 Tax=Adhaeribacter swui TaxID=2086471 RepID=A0A7G7GF11_9BACT|nr:exo-alpha-sialidase [Adhaeribacter swui]